MSTIRWQRFKEAVIAVLLIALVVGLVLGGAWLLSGCAPLGSAPVARLGMSYTQVCDLYGAPVHVTEGGMPEGEVWATWEFGAAGSERIRFKLRATEMEMEDGRRLTRVGYEAVEIVRP